MNKKKIIISAGIIFIILIIVLIISIIHNQIQKNKEAELASKRTGTKELKVVDFYNYPEASDKTVQQVKKEEPKPQPVKSKNIEHKTLDQQASDILFEIKYMSNPKYKKHSATNIANQVMPSGEAIPIWVYKNTASSDLYSNVIRSNKSVIFALYTTPQKEQSGKAMIRRSISRYDITNFKDKSVMQNRNNSVYDTCKKASIDLMCDMKNNYVMPEDNSYRCKCAYDYLQENCTNRFCLINPKQKRIIILDMNEYSLASTLKSLKNW